MSTLYQSKIVHAAEMPGAQAHVPQAKLPFVANWRFLFFLNLLCFAQGPWGLILNVLFKTYFIYLLTCKFRLFVEYKRDLNL